MLFPSAIINKRRRNALFLKLAALQAVILLLIILAVLYTDLTISRNESRLLELSYQQQSQTYNPAEEAARILREFEAQANIQQQAAFLLELPQFNIYRLELLWETIPTGVQLYSAEFDEAGALLTLITNNLSLADIHRYNWENTGLVARAQLISVSSAEDALLRYNLALNWYAYD